MKTEKKFGNSMAVVLLGIMLSAIIGINPNTAYADPPGGRRPVVEKCGDGVRQGEEECDDGGICEGTDTGCTSDANCTDGKHCKPRANDGCSAACRIEIAAPSGPMKVDKLEAEQVTTPVIKADKAEFGETHVDHMDVGTLTVKGSEHFPLPQIALLANYGTSIGSPYSLQLRMKYAAMWGVDNRGTLLGLGLEGGLGFWNWYDTDKSVQPMIPLFAAFQVGNDIGGLAVGPEMWVLAPLSGHKSDEHWELLTMIRIGGWINLPGQHKADAFVMEPWIGIPLYLPRNPSSPTFKDPLLMLGISFGWGHTLNPLPSE